MNTTLWIKKTTKERLDKEGLKGESYDDIITRLLKKNNIPMDPKRTWYRFGTDSIPFFINNAYEAANAYLGKHCLFSYWEGLQNSICMDQAVATKIARKTLKQQLQNHDFAKNIYDEWNIICQDYETYLETFDISTDKKLQETLNELKRFNDLIWNLSMIIEVFDPEGEQLVIEFLESEKTTLQLKQFKTLITPLELTAMQQEHYDLCLIAQHPTDKKLKEHANKYFWSGNSWAIAKHLDKTYFKHKIDRLKEEKMNFVEERKKIDDYMSIIKEERKEILKTTTPSPRIKAVIYLFEMLTLMREERKRLVLLSNHYLDLILDKYVLKLHIPKKELSFATMKEILNWNEDLREELKKRKDIMLFYVDGATEFFITGDEARSFVDDLKREQTPAAQRLHGSVANVGKAEGKARIIYSEKDMEKMNEGDILVAPATRPEFVPAMRKASAIITDEGGITSHAAIVSRELGVPCVVGLKHATTLIKDGMNIKVNANHGVVELP